LTSPAEEPRSRSADDEPDDDAFEELLAECIQAFVAEGADALEELLGRHRDLAPRLRERMDSLERLGMLGGAGSASPSIRDFGPYRVLRTLGQGGMSHVYLAENAITGERVALKVLHAPLHGDSRATRRFEREIEAVSSLSHPRIVSVLESGISDERPWFAMELVEGASLDRILAELRETTEGLEELDGAHVLGIVQRDRSSSRIAERSRGYVESLCRIVLDVAGALEHAHRHGVVHRDVKPANIMVDGDGRAKLLDLGLATLEGSPTLTRTGDFAGTAYYVAPEQTGSIRDSDHRVDVFSLGVTLYEALTLQRPFEGRDAAEILANVQTREPLPPSRLNPLIPRDLETICLCALEKDPARRFATMGAMAADLERFLEFKPVHARPVGRARKLARLARRHPSLSLLALVLLALLVFTPVGLIVVNEAIRKERDHARAAAEEARRQAAIGEAVVDHLVELFSPDGDGEAWTWEQLLEASVERIPSELQEDPLLRAALLEAAGRIHTELGRSAEALPLLDRAFAIRQREGRAPELAATLVWLARAHLEQGHDRDARALAARGLEAMEGKPAIAVASELRLTLAEAARREGDVATARRELETLERLCREQPREAGAYAAEVHRALAELLLEEGELVEARAHAEESLDARRREWTPDPVAWAAALELLARVREAAGEADAGKHLREEAGGIRAALGPERESATGEAWLASYPFELLPPWTAEFERSFQEGITALQTGRRDEAVRAFEACLELSPEHPVVLYNLACTTASFGEVDAALDWLERARASHFGTLRGSLATFRRDPDLAALREEPRFERISRALEAAHAEALERHTTPRTFAPASLTGEDEWPLLVVLTGDRARSSGNREARWREVAERGGRALLLIEGPLVGAESSWVADTDDFLEDPWKVEELPAEVIRAFAAEHPIAPGQVVLVGEGSAGMVAFDLALRAPGLFGRCLILDGVPAPTPKPHLLPIARACGLEVELVVGREAHFDWKPAELEPEALVESLGSWLRAGGLASRAELVPGRAIELAVEELARRAEDAR